MLIAMFDESGRLIGAGTNGQTLTKSLQNFQPLAKASPATKRVVYTRQKSKTLSRSNPWRYQTEKQKSRLDDLAKTLSAIARGEPLFKSFGAQRCAPDPTMGAAMQKLPVEHRQPHVVRELRAMGVAI